MGIFTQLLGIITLALPISIIGSNFIDERAKVLELTSATDLEERLTLPGEQRALSFPVDRAKVVVKAMDFIDDELQRMSQVSVVMALGLLKLQAHLKEKECE